MLQEDLEDQGRLDLRDLPDQQVGQDLEEFLAGKEGLVDQGHEEILVLLDHLDQGVFLVDQEVWAQLDLQASCREDKIQFIMALLVIT